MRLILGDGPAGDLDDSALARAYAYPGSGSWWRANMIASLDGSVTGADGLSGSLHTPADHVVFELLRALADVVVVAAGTVRDEGYGPLSGPGERWRSLRDGRSPVPALVVVSGSGRLPAAVVAPGQDVYLATAADADTQAAEALVGADHILVVGEDGTVDPGRLRAALDDLGLTRALIEGGPKWLRAVVAAGALDELCLTTSPRLVGTGPQLLAGDPVDVAARPTLLIEDDATLLGRWRLARS